MAELTVHTIELAQGPGTTERDNRYVDGVVNFEPATSALLLIDVWAHHPNEGWMARADQNIREFLAPAVEAARNSGLTIIHAPTNQAVHPVVGVKEGEYVIDSSNGVDDGIEVQELFQRLGVRTAFLAGYATNLCLTFKPAGGYYVWLREGARVRMILLEDSTIAFEMPDTLEQELSRKVFTSLYKMFAGGTATNESLFRALASDPTGVGYRA